MSIEKDLQAIFNETPDEDVLRRYISAEKNSALSFMIAGLVHDTKGFITPILGSAEVGKICAEEKNDSELAGCFKTIIESAVRLDKLINNFLDFSKRKDYTRGTVYINEILTIVLNFYQAQYTIAKVNLNADLKTVPAIEGYAAGLESVFVNMLTNALHSYKSVPHARPKTVNVRSYQKDGYICVEFEDDGCGIKKENLARIFDFMFTTKEKGHGIGLAYARMIVEDSHFGKLCVESENSKGTRFTIKLPDPKTLKLMREETFYGPKRS